MVRKTLFKTIAADVKIIPMGREIRLNSEYSTNGDSQPRSRKGRSVDRKLSGWKIIKRRNQM